MSPLYRCRDCGEKRSSDPFGICWVCEGERKLTVGQRAYLMAVKRLEIRSFAHCDGNVLHARGTCRYCSMAQYDRLHELRRRFNVAYTGATLESGQEPCPSEAWRPVDIIEKWPGNRAAPI